MRFPFFPRSWTSKTKPRLSPQRTPRKRPATTRLAVEPLEDRTVPSFGFGWALGLGSAGRDQGRSIAADLAGNVYVTGYFAGTVDFDPAPDRTYNLSTANLYDTFTAKYSPDGCLVWAQQWNVQSIPAAIAVQGANVYVYGRVSDNLQPGGFSWQVTKLVTAVDPAGTESAAVAWTGTVNMHGFSGIAIGPSGSLYVGRATAGEALAITKLDPTDGHTVWVRQTGGDNQYTYARGVAVDSSENVYTTGLYSGTLDFDPDPVKTFWLTSTTSRSSPTGDVFVWKLTKDGDFVWARSMGGDGHDDGYGIAAAGGYVYVNGNFDSSSRSNDLDPGPGVVRLTGTNNGSRSVFVVKLTDGGDLAWARSLVGADYADGVAVDGAGNVYTIGTFHGSADFDPGSVKFNLKSAGGDDRFVWKLTSAGDFAAAVSMGGNGQDLGLSIALDGLGNVYTTGQFENTVDFDPTSGTFSLTSAGQTDIFVSKLTQSSPLLAAGGAAPGRSPTEPITPQVVGPLVGEAIARWQAAGVDTASLSTIDIRIANLAGATLGLASGNTIWLDGNAAGWGWFLDLTPWDDSEFTTPGDQGEQNRMDLLTVLAHELGHLLGLEHDDEGVMAETLVPGVRLSPTSGEGTARPLAGFVEWSLGDYQRWDAIALAVALESTTRRKA